MLSIDTIARPMGTARGPLFDEDGFLTDQSLWTPELGTSIAEQVGVGALTEKHWRVIEQFRQRFFSLGALPNLRRVCRATALSRVEIYNLFGGCLTIWRIAGLPNPGEEAKAYLI
jgi:TusE/DsrC/DsvC family sulfur relay protein